MKIGLFALTADLLHAGHILAMREAKSLCDYLIVCTCANCNKDTVQTLFERTIQLQAVRYVDEVVVCQDEDDKKNLLLGLNYDICFVGADYKNKRFQYQDLLEQMGKQIIYLHRDHNLSSSNLKQRIIEKYGNK
jgi:glycerol-3-phosphate cytidylyltransferase